MSDGFLSEYLFSSKLLASMNDWNIPSIDWKLYFWFGDLRYTWPRGTVDFLTIRRDVFRAENARIARRIRSALLPPETP